MMHLTQDAASRSIGPKWTAVTYTEHQEELEPSEGSVFIWGTRELETDHGNERVKFQAYQLKSGAFLIHDPSLDTVTLDASTDPETRQVMTLHGANLYWTENGALVINNGPRSEIIENDGAIKIITGETFVSRGEELGAKVREFTIKPDSDQVEGRGWNLVEGKTGLPFTTSPIYLGEDENIHIPVWDVEGKRLPDEVVEPLITRQQVLGK
ncbi:MAG: hypothetical protein HYU64_04820 [Armatimonadetes bacterium]|nr:hypothetical protein [Armatimonadota bacterium]